MKDCDIIPTNQALYCEDDKNNCIVKVPKELFANNVGDVLITQDGNTSPPGLFMVHWNAAITNFTVTQIPVPTSNIHSFEQSTFAPIDIPPVSP